MESFEQRISRDKLAKYKGTALISIAHLDFPHPSRQVDRKIIEQLKRDFEGEGCTKDEPTNRIPARRVHLATGQTEQWANVIKAHFTLLKL
jgi:hypothetical protein